MMQVRAASPPTVNGVCGSYTSWC